MAIRLIFAILALVCFSLEAAGVAFPRVKLLTLGLAFLTVALMLV